MDASIISAISAIAPQAAAVAFLVLCVVAIPVGWYNQLRGRENAPLPIQSLGKIPILQVELAWNACQLNTVFKPEKLKDNPDALAKIIRDARRGNWLDTWLFIPSYLVLLLSIGLGLLHGNHRWFLVLPLFAAVCDWKENSGITKVFNKLEAGGELQDTDATRISTPSFVKWVTLTPILLVYSVAAFRHIDSWNWLLGVIGFAGIGLSVVLAYRLIWYSSQRWGQTITATILYLYFMRFSILLWAFLVFLPALDWSGATNSFTHGMFALEVRGGLPFAWASGWLWSLAQFIWVSFYVFLSGWIALLSARIVCAYGGDRFKSMPPRFFKIAGETPSDREGMSWYAFLGSQIPGLWFLWYTARVSLSESFGKHPVLLSGVLVGFLIGFVSAGLLWLLNDFLYRIVSPPGSTRVHDLFVPRLWAAARSFQEELRQAPRWVPRWLRWLLSLVARLGPGFAPDLEQEPNPGITMAVVLFFFLLLIHLLVGYLTKPIPTEALRTASHTLFWAWRILIAILPLLFFLMLCVRPAKRDEHGNKTSRAGFRWRIAVALIAASVLFAALVWGSFPVLATILILAFSLCWAGTGLAFWLDRWRVPVIATALVALLLSSWALSLNHFYTTFLGAHVKPPEPTDVINKFKAQLLNDPMIVVTASGGGIHSALWTATVLDGLERAFKDNKKKKGFHQHVVLMSSVSGGSVAASYLVESYLDAANGRAPFDTTSTRSIIKHEVAQALSLPRGECYSRTSIVSSFGKTWWRECSLAFASGTGAGRWRLLSKRIAKRAASGSITRFLSLRPIS